MSATRTAVKLNVSVHLFTHRRPHDSGEVDEDRAVGMNPPAPVQR